MEILDNEKERQVLAFYDGILRHIEAETGKPVYKVPGEYELNNLRAYTNNPEASEAFKQELDVLQYVPAEYFSRFDDANSPHSEKYRAWVYLSGSKSFLTVVVSKTDIPEGDKYVGIESYLVDPVEPIKLKPELRATKHQRSFVTYKDYEDALPEKRRKLAQSKSNKNDKEWQYFIEGRDLTEKVNAIINSQQNG